MAYTSELRVPAGSNADDDSREYRWIYAATLPFFLLTTALGRLFSGRAAAGTARESLLSEASATAHTVIPFAYMR